MAMRKPDPRMGEFDSITRLFCMKGDSLKFLMTSVSYEGLDTLQELNGTLTPQAALILQAVKFASSQVEDFCAYSGIETLEQYADRREAK